jgi:hypothetical protein
MRHAPGNASRTADRPPVIACFERVSSSASKKWKSWVKSSQMIELLWETPLDAIPANAE